MAFVTDFVLPITAALMLWWGATGIIIYLARRPKARLWLFGAATLALPFGFWGLAGTRSDNTTGGVFAAFLWTVLIWSWVEVSYYTGYVVGLHEPELEPDAPTRVRFVGAVRANLWHELAIISLSLLVWLVGGGGINEVGLWAFMILHWGHQSAKINIFLGVRNLTVEFLPDHLKPMAQYFKQRNFNRFFPVSLGIGIAACIYLGATFAGATSNGVRLGQAILFILMFVAVLEHWWLIAPKRSRAWDWSLAGTEETQKVELDLVCGYLGSGKTTLIRHLLPQLGRRTAIIVNDFGSVGIDAAVLGDGTTPVVELAGGCICCTLQNDLGKQIVAVIKQYAPERIIIEPSGVAGVGDVLRAMGSAGVREQIASIRVIAVIEAARLLTDESAETAGFVRAQLDAADVVVASKADLLPAGLSSRAVVVATARRNPRPRVVLAEYGRVEAATLFGDTARDHTTTGTHDHAQTPAFESVAHEFDAVLDARAVAGLFDGLRQGVYGEVARAKALVTVAGGGQHLELASGRVAIEIAPGVPTHNKVLVIGHNLQQERIMAALAACDARQTVGV